MLITIIVFIIILALLVLVHELGHFYTARKCGVKCDEFGFGFPPRLCGWKKVNGKRKFFWGRKDVESEDTIYSINWLPLGGFVKIKGEDGENRDDKDSFGFQKIWKRVLIVSAGVVMNVFLAMIALSIAFMVGLPQVVDLEKPNQTIVNPQIQIMEVLGDSPAEEGGLKLGDVVLKVDGQEITEAEQVNVLVKRMDKEEEVTVIPSQIEEFDSVGLGVSLVKTGIVSYPWYQSIWLGIKNTFVLLAKIMVAFAILIKNLVTGAPIGLEVAGPVGIAVMTGQVSRMGFVYVLQFIAILSLNLAIINFLPFPALDGGRVIFLIIEKIRRKPVSQKIENFIHTVGFALLLILMAVVIGWDIFKYI